MDTDGDRLWLLLGLLFGCGLLRAWFSACESALTEVNDARVHTLAAQDSRWAALDKMISAPSKLLLCFTSHRVLSAVWIGVLSFGIVAPRAAEWLPIRDAGFVVGLVLAVLLALVMTACTDLLPKRMAASGSERFARHCVWSVRVLMTVLTPFLLVSHALTALFCRLFRVAQTSGTEVVTEEEIRMLVDAGNETGGIEESQREMINNIFAFDDVTVEEVMTHRRDMVAVQSNTMALEMAKLAMEEGFSRIPVYERSIDTIVGVVLVKDLLPLVGRQGDCPVLSLMREAVFVPETAKCRDVFQRMRKEKIQLAIVSDEYGGTAGMVTMEDLLEEIVGNIQDEYDDEEAELTEVSKGVFSIDGAADPEDILPKLGVAPEVGKDFDTMSAYVVQLLGRIPSVGERPTVESDGVRYTLLSFEDHWIRRIQAEVLPVVASEKPA